MTETTRVWLYAQHCIRAGQVAQALMAEKTPAELEADDDLISLDAEAARMWAALPATAANDFNRRAGRAAMEYLGEPEPYDQEDRETALRLYPAITEAWENEGTHKTREAALRAMLEDDLVADITEAHAEDDQPSDRQIARLAAAIHALVREDLPEENA